MEEDKAASAGTPPQFDWQYPIHWQGPISGLTLAIYIAALRKLDPLTQSCHWMIVGWDSHDSQTEGD